MKNLLVKYQKQLSMGLAISVLILCYFQRREINKLRQQLNIETKIDETNIEIKSQEVDVDTLFLRND